MKPMQSLSRFFVLFVCLTTSLSRSVFALHPQEPKENTGLEEALTGALYSTIKSSTSGLEEILLPVKEVEQRQLRGLAEAIQGRTGRNVLRPGDAKKLLKDSSWDGIPWFDNGWVNVSAILSEGAGQVIAALEPGTWDEERINLYFGIQAASRGRSPAESVRAGDGGFVFSKRANWNGVVRVVGIPRKVRQLGRTDKRVEIGIKKEDSGRLLIFMEKELLEFLPKRIPAFLAVTAFAMESPRDISAPADPVPLQFNWFRISRGDMAYDPFSGRLFVITDFKNIEEFDAVSGKRIHTFKGAAEILQQWGGLNRLEFDPQTGTLFAMGFASADDQRRGGDVILRIDTNERPWRPAVLIGNPHIDDGNRFLGLSYDAGSKTLLVLISKKIPYALPTDREEGLEDEDFFPSGPKRERRLEWKGAAVLESAELRFYDALTGNPKRGPQLTLEHPLAIAYDPTKKRIFVAVRDRGSPFEWTVEAYDARSGNSTGWKKPFEGTPWDIHFDPIRQKLFLVHSNGIQEFDFAATDHPARSRNPVAETLNQPRHVLHAPYTDALFVLERFVLGGSTALGRLRAFSMKTGRPTFVPEGLGLTNPFLKPQASGEGELLDLHPHIMQLIREGHIDRIRIFGETEMQPTDQDIENRYINLGVRWHRNHIKRIHFQRDGRTLIISPIPDEESRKPTGSSDDASGLEESTLDLLARDILDRATRVQSASTVRFDEANKLFLSAYLSQLNFLREAGFMKRILYL